MTEQTPEYRALKAPQGQVVPETPDTRAPNERNLTYNPFGVYGQWLGDPERRYGRLKLAGSIPAHTKLEMLRDPVIAMCMGFIASTMVKARRVIECPNERKRQFFEAMFREWEREFMLQASIAVAMGGLGLIKKFEFRQPAVRPGQEPAWPYKATPYIVTGFDMAYPLTSSPRFSDNRRHFQGIDAPEGPIDVYFSLWLTINKVRSFGAYEGSGRLENAYRDWWMKSFARDLYLVGLQRNVNPVVEVTYPPGKTDDQSNQSIALATGDSVRGGATVAIPGDVYPIIDNMTGDERLSGVRKWALRFLESSRGVSEFHLIDDHHDRKIALGMNVPPQAFMEVTGGDLGGPTSADKLGEMAEEMLMMDAADIDRHVNEYVFPTISRVNFPPDSPPVKVHTVGLDPSSRAEIFRILSALLSRADVPPVVMDIPEAMQRLGLPVNPAIIAAGGVPLPAQEAPAQASGDDCGAGEGIGLEAASHTPVTIPAPCPLGGCDGTHAFSYPGHGPWVVCQTCGRSYNLKSYPEVGYAVQEVGYAGA